MSVAELFSMFTFCFSLYRLKMLEYYKELSFVILLLPYISYANRFGFQQEGIDPLIQLGLLILFMWLLFRIQIFYAALISVSGFIMNLLTQTIVIFSLSSTGIIDREKVVTGSGADTYLMQLVSCVAICLVALIIHKSNRGFSFVPTSSSRFKEKIKGNTTILLSIITTAILATVVFTYYWFFDNHGYSFIFVILITITLLASILFYSYKKDYER